MNGIVFKLLSKFPLGYTENYYRPQRSWAKVMFLQESVILLTGGCMLGYQPPQDQTPREQTPREQTPPWTMHPPGPYTPPEQTPLDQTPPRSRHHPPEQTPPGSRPLWTRPRPQEADTSIRRSMSGRYASHWNAFLFANTFKYLSWITKKSVENRAGHMKISNEYINT